MGSRYGPDQVECENLLNPDAAVSLLASTRKGWHLLESESRWIRRSLEPKWRGPIIAKSKDCFGLLFYCRILGCFGRRHPCSVECAKHALRKYPDINISTRPSHHILITDLITGHSLSTVQSSSVMHLMRNDMKLQEREKTETMSTSEVGCRLPLPVSYLGARERALSNQRSQPSFNFNLSLTSYRN